MSAVLSECRTYRYTLTRNWGDGDKVLCCIGLNPSKADETLDDPTIRKLIAFARLWGYDGLVMLNLFAFRSTDPKNLKTHRVPIGPDNDTWLVRETEGRDVLCAWGNPGSYLGRDKAVWDTILSKRNCFCLGVNGNGSPKHPLYLSYKTVRKPWRHLEH